MSMLEAARRVRGWLVRVVLASAHALCLLIEFLPPELLAAPTSDSPPSDPPGIEAAVAEIESAFVAAATASGLPALGPARSEVVRTERDGSTLIAIVAAAAVPVSERSEPNFFWRRTTLVRVSADRPPETLSHSDLRLSYSTPRVTVSISDRFSEDIDRFAGADTGLAGVEVRRSAEFDSANLERLATIEAQAGGGADDGGADHGSPRRQAALRDQLEAENYRETLTVVMPDGGERSYPAATDVRALLLGSTGGAAELTVGCISDCFDENGGAIGLAGALCLVAGLVVCVAACAASAGVACLPCIAASGAVCGLAIAGGSLGVCIARCINPEFSPPSTTPTVTPPTFSLTVEPLAAAAGYDVRVRWTAPPQHGANDRIALYPEGAANEEYLSFQYLSAETSGELTFQAPTSPGHYELRILLDDGLSEPNPARRESLLIGSYSLSLAQSSAAPGTPLDVSWTAPDGHSDTDWIGFFAQNTGNSEYRQYRYLSATTSGAVSFEGPQTPGLYEVRVLVRGSFTEPGPAIRRGILVGSCPIGDCNGNAAVTVDEITRMVALRLDAPGGHACGAVEDQPTGAEIGAAATYALSGCGPGRICSAERPCDAAYLACDIRAMRCLPSDTGICELRPPGCSLVFDPVCGCDGVTYSNDCDRLAAEAPLKSTGACP